MLAATDPQSGEDTENSGDPATQARWQKGSRPVKYHDLGVRGRRTGVTAPENVQLDENGLMEIEGWFNDSDTDELTRGEDAAAGKISTPKPAAPENGAPESIKHLDSPLSAKNIPSERSPFRRSPAVHNAISRLPRPSMPTIHPFESPGAKESLPSTPCRFSNISKSSVVEASPQATLSPPREPRFNLGDVRIPAVSLDKSGQSNKQAYSSAASVHLHESRSYSNVQAAKSSSHPLEQGVYNYPEADMEQAVQSEYSDHMHEERDDQNHSIGSGQDHSRSPERLQKNSPHVSATPEPSDELIEQRSDGRKRKAAAGSDSDDEGVTETSQQRRNVINPSTKHMSSKKHAAADGNRTEAYRENNGGKIHQGHPRAQTARKAQTSGTIPEVTLERRSTKKATSARTVSDPQSGRRSTRIEQDDVDEIPSTDDVDMSPSVNQSRRLERTVRNSANARASTSKNGSGHKAQPQTQKIVKKVLVSRPDIDEAIKSSPEMATHYSRPPPRHVSTKARNDKSKRKVTPEPELSPPPRHEAKRQAIMESESEDEETAQDEVEASNQEYHMEQPELGDHQFHMPDEDGYESYEQPASDVGMEVDDDNDNNDHNNNEENQESEDDRAEPEPSPPIRKRATIKTSKKGKTASTNKAPKPNPARGKRSVKEAETFMAEDGDKEDENGCRRSRRMKISPLKFWAGERVVLKRRESGYCPVPVVQEVIRVDSDEEEVDRKKARARAARVKREATPLVQPDVPVINVSTGKEEDQHIVLTPEMWNPRSTGSGYKFQKVFSEGNFIASGVLVMPKGSEKPNKNSQMSAMVFYVMSGEVEVQVHKTIFVVKTGSQFFIPRGNQYRIANHGNREARLFFCHGKEIVQKAGAETD
ncbi:hypothetical protein DFJ77DRAFT_478762 [Powellomyces hirtus]|nr:hypothetical protein DFJ77DRAFT_478762 [Powellomyces hirtus]